jgi:hypothetical protein
MAPKLKTKDKGSSKQRNHAKHLTSKHSSRWMWPGRHPISREMQPFLLDYVDAASLQATKDMKDARRAMRWKTRSPHSTRNPPGPANVSIELSSSSKCRPLPSNVDSLCLSLRMTDQEVALLDSLLNGPDNTSNPADHGMSNSPPPSSPMDSESSCVTPENISDLEGHACGGSAGVANDFVEPSALLLDSSIPLLTPDLSYSPYTKDYSLTSVAQDDAVSLLSNVDACDLCLPP